MTGLRKYWPWLRLLLGLALIGGLGWKLGTTAFVDGVRAINGWSVIAALAIGLLTTVLSASRWVVVSRRLGQPLNLKTAVAEYYRSQLLNAVLPAGVLGDVDRALRRGIRSVVLERLAGQLVLVALGLLVLLPRLPLAALTILLSTILPSTILLGTALAVGTKRVRGLVGKLVLGPEVVLLSLGAVAGHVTMFVIAARAAGTTVPVSRLVPLAVLALLVMALPVNLAGFGPREVYLAAAFGSVGLGAAQGVTTGVVYGVLAMIAALPGALALFRKQTNEEPDEHSRVRQLALSPA